MLTGGRHVQPRADSELARGDRHARLVFAVVPNGEDRLGGELTTAQQRHVRANPDDVPFTYDFRFGWPDSPLIHRHSELRLNEDEGGVRAVRAKHFSVGWFSWSSLTLAVAVALLWAAKRLWPVPAKPAEPVS